MWFGGVASYGNIMREVYAIIYAWIDERDLPEVDGLCEEDDGISFRLAVINSLRIVRAKHKQESIARLYAKLDSTQLVMRTGGMASYFAKINKLRLDLKKLHEQVSDSYLLHRTYDATRDKHVKLAETISRMRQVAGTTGVATTFAHAKDTLIDVFQFEIPDKDKNEKIPNKIRAGYAGSGPQKRKTGGRQQRRSSGRPRREFAKGSCKHHPQATDHTTSHCFITKRNIKGLPPGWAWCSLHTKSLHYDHECFRHKPNFPSPPKIAVRSATASEDASALQARILAMVGAQTLAGTQQKPQPVTKANKATPSIVITPAQPPRTAPGASTNSVISGPPVQAVLQHILKLSKPDRSLLASRLSKAGF